MGSLRVRLAVVVGVTFLLQISLLDQLRLFDVAPDSLLLLTILVGYTANRELAALVGFSAGLLFDLVLASPVGIAALTLAVIGHFVAASQESMLETGVVARVLGLVAFSMAGVFLFAAIGEIFGQNTLIMPRTLRIAIVVGIMNLVLAVVVRPAVRWALSGEEGSRTPPRRFMVG